MTDKTDKEVLIAKLSVKYGLFGYSFEDIEELLRDKRFDLSGIKLEHFLLGQVVTSSRSYRTYNNIICIKGEEDNIIIGAERQIHKEDLYLRTVATIQDYEREVVARSLNPPYISIIYSQAYGRFEKAFKVSDFKVEDMPRIVRG